MRSSKFLLAIFILGLSLVGCGGDSAHLLKSQVWNGISFFIEIRSNPRIPSMYELLVVATRQDRKPAFDMIVSVSSSSQTTPVQTIQDGHSGVFRRALRLDMSNSGEAIQVHIQSREKGAEGNTVLSFPVQSSQ